MTIKYINLCIIISHKMYNKNIRIDSDVDEHLKKCVDEFLRHHPELERIHISYNKIIYEICKFYLKN